MSFEELQDLYFRIVCGYALIPYKDEIYQVHDPKPKDEYLGRIKYLKLLEEFVLEGVATEEQQVCLLRERGLWGDKEENQIKTSQDLIKSLSKQIPGLEFKSTEKRKLTQQIENLNKYVSNLYKKKNTLLSQSAEYLARYQIFKFYVETLTSSHSPETMTESLISHLISEAYCSDSLTEAGIRKLARSEPWRSVWISATKTGDLFPFSMSEMTNFQRSLVAWSMIYDSAYESMDPPSNDVVDNDVLFNEWLDQQTAKRNKESRKSSGFTQNSKIQNAQEVMIVVDSPEDAQKVFEMNSPEAMKVIKSREKVLQSSAGKDLKTTDLPDVRRQLKMQANEIARNRIQNG